ncbi:hypothetical protein FA10DRAFT_265907 [Acaromyces ingoldii]|uniref:Uncharacterized protein n=1 Tax=Acaromyces ingoldii TaxID=215250 RepID=A0A316YVM9_9BASI|nr:hypothetical protein FA10DRAFT_265907 [Acaromyces ingoldii]PWN92103.1 hypothetical protein FA10DRAFT_265907 [Acaromyces ingoldii]
MANLKRSASESEDEKEVLSPKSSHKRPKSTIDKASPRKASPTKKPTDGTSRSPTKALSKDWSFEEELCIIHKVFGGKLPTLSNQDVEELSATLGRTPCSIRTYYSRRIRPKFMPPSSSKSTKPSHSDEDEK